MAVRVASFVALAAVVALAPSPAAAQQSSSPDLSGYDFGWHIVRPGENMHLITRKYLGDRLLWRENWDLNPEIQDPDRLTPGQRIKVLIERQDSVPTARLRSVAGRVEGKPAPIAWNPARESDLMLEEDGIRTGNRASTELEFSDDTRVVMTEESVLYLRRRGRSLVGMPPRAVEIVQGEAEVAAQRPAGSEASIEILVAGTRAVSRPDATGVAQTRARRTESDGAAVMVYEGGGEVESGGQKVAVARGMGTAVERGKPPAPPEKLLPQPTGLRPEPGSQLTHNDVELAWQPVAGAEAYTAELCRDPRCARLVERRVGLSEPRWEPSTPAQGEYFWRVTAVSASGLDGYPSPGAALAVRGGPDRQGPTGSLTIAGRQLRFGSLLLVDENVLVEPRLADSQSGVAGWRPVIDGVEVSRQRWDGPWPDGTYKVAVRAMDRAGNDAVIAAAEEIVVDATPPVISVGGTDLAGVESRRRDRSRCGWLPQAVWRWSDVSQCRWVGKAQQRWLRQGWSWLEVSAEGRWWNPLIADGSAPAAEVARAGYRLAPSPATMRVEGANPQLLVRSADGSSLLAPDGSEIGAVLRIRVDDGGAGVAWVELRAGETEAGELTLSVEAADVFDHRHRLAWAATPAR